MPVAITLTLTPERDATLPQNVGRANYAALLARLSRFDHALSAQLHDMDGPKPLTCSDLLGARRNRSGATIRADEEYKLRFTGLSAAVSHALLEAFAARRPHLWRVLQKSGVG